jgi:hypothetical protein
MPARERCSKESVGARPGQGAVPPPPSPLHPPTQQLARVRKHREGQGFAAAVCGLVLLSSSRQCNT